MTMKKNTILVTGGAGYIGSHTLVDLINNGFDVLCIDNFVRSYPDSLTGVQHITGKEITNYAIDLCDLNATREVFRLHPEIVGIIHFAAYKSVNESVQHPIMYYENNLYSLINILKCIDEFDISYFVFSSSCSVYGNTNHLPVVETTPLSKPECAYAATKQMGEQMIIDFGRVSKAKSIALRYFNPVGAHTSGLIGEVPIDKPNNLVPVITQCAIGITDKMYVWGDDYDTRDGSCIRDYVHVMDIASAHTKAMTYLMNSKVPIPCEILNLGTGTGVSVLEAIHAFEEVSGVQLNYEIGPRREGDVVAIYADNTLVKEKLHWSPEHDIHSMMRTAWEWQNVLVNKKVSI